MNKGRVASPSLFVEEITARHKMRKMSEKGKKKVGASIWADVETTLAPTNEIVTFEELKEISGVPSHDMVNFHVHKPVQVTFHYFPSPFSSFFFIYFLFIYFLTLSISIAHDAILDARCWRRRCISLLST